MSSFTSCLQSIRTLSILALLTILSLGFVCVTAVWGVSYTLNISKFTDNLRASLFQLTLIKVKESLQTPISILQIAADAVRADNIELVNTTCSSLSPVLWKHFLSMEADLDELGFTSIYFGLLDGSICGYSRDYGESKISLHLNSWPYNRILDITPVNHPAEINDGMILYNDTMALDYSDLFVYLFTNNSQWVKSYDYPAFEAVWISAVVPFFKPTGEHYGFIAYDADVRALSETLYRIKIGADDGCTFLLEWETWYLLGTSFIEKKSFNVLSSPDGPSIQRLRGEQFGEPAVANTVLHMYNLFGNSFEQFDSNHDNKFQYTANGVTYLVIAERIITKGADVIVVMVIPQMYFLSEFVAAICAASAVSILLLMISVIFVVIGITVFVQPIYSLISQFHKIESMQLDKVTFSRSFFTEIRRLQQGFSHMTGKLKEYRAFIPEHLLDNEELEAESSQLTSTEPSPAASNRKHGVYLDPARRKITPTEDGTKSPSSISVSSKMVKTESMFTLGLAYKDVTVLCIRTSSFKEMLQTLTAPEMVELHGQLITGITPILKRNGGQMVSFNKEEILIAFNALRNQINHVSLACQTALKVKEVVTSIQQENSSRVDFKAWMSITSGSMYAGNIGSHTMKQFCVEGAAIEIASKLAYLGPTLGACILVDEKVVATVEKSFNFRGVERIQFMDTSSRIITVSCLESSKTVTSDEWMYEVQTLSSLEKFNIYKQAFEHYVAGQFEQALVLFSESLLHVPDDEPTKRLVALCRQFSKSESKQGFMLRLSSDAQFVPFETNLMKEQ